jgi:hypothetical protein
MRNQKKSTCLAIIFYKFGSSIFYLLWRTPPWLEANGVAESMWIHHQITPIVPLTEQCYPFYWLPSNRWNGYSHTIVFAHFPRVSTAILFDKIAGDSY